MELNADQHRAVTTLEGPVLILAGPGSGKTLTLVGRILVLIKTHRVSPENILAITFTQKAAQEISKRLHSFLGENAQLPLVSTFHAFAFHWLKQQSALWPEAASFQVISSADQKRLVKELLKEKPELNWTPKEALQLLTQLKSRPPQDNSSVDLQALNFLQAYQARLQERNALDFDDLLWRTLELFKQYPERLSKEHNPFRYILVDEAQDTNPIQAELLHHLSQAHRNLCLIGDPDQAIYGFRGASLETFLNFQTVYPETQVCHLEQNYRSSRILVKASQALIEKNGQRLPKKMWTSHEDHARIHITSVSTAWQEASFILNTIEQLIGGSNSLHAQEVSRTAVSETAYHFNDIVVLYRLNAVGRFLENSFAKAGLPYQRVGEIGFFERREILDVLAFLKTFSEAKITCDLEAWERILKTFVPQFGKTKWDAFQARVKEGEMPHLILESLISEAPFVERWKRAVEMAATLPVSKQIRMILEKFELKSHYEDGTSKGQRRYDHLLELINVAIRYDSLEPEHGRRELLQLALFARPEDHFNPHREAITLMSVHAAKGLEFPVVFVAGLEEGIFPYLPAEDFDGEAPNGFAGWRATCLPAGRREPLLMEEERRLFYVAMTRAKERLYLSHSEERALFDTKEKGIPSRFLSEIPEEFVERSMIKMQTKKATVSVPSPQLELF